jgi:hypothetical protein
MTKCHSDVADARTNGPTVTAHHVLSLICDVLPPVRRLRVWLLTSFISKENAINVQAHPDHVRICVGHEHRQALVPNIDLEIFHPRLADSIDLVVGWQYTRHDLEYIGDLL